MQIDKRQKRPRRGRYRYEKARDASDWDGVGVRHSMQQALLTTLVLEPNAVCVDCGTAATTLCRSCSVSIVRCESCMNQYHHGMPNHDIFIVRHEEVGLQPYRPLCPPSLAIHPACPPQNQSLLTFVALKGSQKYQLNYCDCMSQSEQLIKLGYWPARPTNPTYAFSLDLMSLYRTVNLNSKVAVKSFCQVLKDAGNPYFLRKLCTT